MSDAVKWSASRIAEAIRCREISSEEMVHACIARIEQVNPKLNAVGGRFVGVVRYQIVAKSQSC